MNSKRCTKCKEVKSFNEFHNHPKLKDGKNTQCKDCIKIVRYKYLTENKHITKAYLEKNKGKISIQNKKYTKKWRDNNKSVTSEYNKNYKKANIEKVSTLKKKWNEANKDRIKDCQRLYYKNNREHILEKNREWNKKNKHVVGWRTVLRSYFRRIGKTKEKKTIEILGYTALDLKQHIEKLFTDSMSWDNYGVWHIDHIKPLSSFNEDTPPDVANALSNLQPLWATTREINGILYLGNLNKHNNE